ncbi:hypothetical protein ES703_86802 [subsurface metagenome]
MSKHKNPFAKGTAPRKIWRHGYFHGQIDTYHKINKSIPSKEELEEEMQKAIEVMAAKFNNKIM